MESRGLWTHLFGYSTFIYFLVTPNLPYKFVIATFYMTGKNNID